MRLNIAIPEAHVSAPVLNGALEAVTRLNESLIKAGASPTSYELLEQGARWQPEPPGEEHFDHGAEIASRGWGDCDDWGPLHAATLRVLGIDPGAKSVVRKTGPTRWHATTMRSDGTEDDPSLKAGMPGPRKVEGCRGATLPIMFPRRTLHGVNRQVTGVNGADVGSYLGIPQLALRPIPDRYGQVEAWQARADLPWHWAPGSSPADVAMASLHQSPVSAQSVVGAVRGAFRVGLANGADPEQLKRLSAIADACEGCPWEELAEMYGPQHATAAGAVVGSFFGKALRKVGKLAKGAVRLASPALSLIPGGSIATAAFNMASPALKRAVLKQQNEPPAKRTGLALSPQQSLPRAPQRAAAPPAPPGGAGFPGGNWLPYPYPLPYPVPGWGAATSDPGAAWPPRG